jgi:sterol desaturase/sphingolipid hydroxylase (fatty acid hydroxylase superfamily)
VYERRSEPLISRRAFFRRLWLHVLVGVGITAASLGVGVLGYMVLAGLAPIDAFLNAAMILGGMGPVDQLHSDGAKLFAGLYALFSGFILLGVAAVILTPVFHRLLHRFHLDPEDVDVTADTVTGEAQAAPG